MITKEEHEDVDDEIAGKVCQLVMRLKRKKFTARIVKIIFPREELQTNLNRMFGGEDKVNTGHTVRQLIDDRNNKRKVIFAIYFVFIWPRKTMSANG